MYQRYVKRILDFILSLAATIVLLFRMGDHCPVDQRLILPARYFSSSGASARARPTLTF